MFKKTAPASRLPQWVRARFGISRRNLIKAALALTTSIGLTLVGLHLPSTGPDQALAEALASDPPIYLPDPPAALPGLPFDVPGLPFDLPVGVTPLGGQGATRPISPHGCTRKVGSAQAPAAVMAAKAGDKICVVGGTGEHLHLVRTGSLQPRITVSGDGKSYFKGVSVKSDNITVENFNSHDHAPGMDFVGTNITFRNNVVESPTGGDNDGLRFFGTNLVIANNTFSESRNINGAHADCMQTFASDSPPSHHVVIDNNRCVKIDNQCLIVEGPNVPDGDHKGHTYDIIFSRNYCEANASQAVMLSDAQRVTIVFNDIHSVHTGELDKGFAYSLGSTGGKVFGNRLAPDIPCEVGMDDSSRPGYIGPEPKCEP